ncbi:MAG: TetR/AcrR family transcriptional regulator [Aquabacterium sp.]
MPVSKNRVNPPSPVNTGNTGRRYGGIDSEERQRQRKARLVEAGLTVFGEKGFHQSTVRDVCKAAQLTSRYFYESFDSMEDLFRAVYTTVSKQLMQATVMSLASCSPEPEKLAAAGLRTFYEYIREDTHRARVMLIDAFTVGELMYQHTSQTNQDFAHLIMGIMEQQFPGLEKLGLNIKSIADGLVGANNQIASTWVADRCKTPLDDVLRNSLMIYEACIDFARKHSTATN